MEGITLGLLLCIQSLFNFFFSTFSLKRKGEAQGSRTGMLPLPVPVHAQQPVITGTDHSLRWTVSSLNVSSLLILTFRLFQVLYQQILQALYSAS